AGLGRIREELEKAGRESKGFQVQNYVPVVAGEGGAVDVEKTMSVVPAMVEGGVTDFRITLRLPNEEAAVQDLLSPLVETFRKAAGRS
ncbi:MAG: hypothetical protein CL908_25280, partial [Deltaproteobacteria bacterium]|nr:hypothetical protein [Deltaproteobacteria bacterium]